MVHTTDTWCRRLILSKNVLPCEEPDVFGVLPILVDHWTFYFIWTLLGATTVIFEGVPSHPDFSRFWEIIEKHKVSQFYTVSTGSALWQKESIEYVQKI
jgi:acetyl-CoA synthetase